MILQMDAQGRIVLPQKLRGKERQYYTCYTEADGTVHLIPVVGVITPKQAYFWTKRWQKGEEEASRAIQKKKYKTVHQNRKGLKKA